MCKSTPGSGLHQVMEFPMAYVKYTIGIEWLSRFLGIFKWSIQDRDNNTIDIINRCKSTDTRLQIRPPYLIPIYSPDTHTMGVPAFFAWLCKRYPDIIKICKEEHVRKSIEEKEVLWTRALRHNTSQDARTCPWSSFFFWCCFAPQIFLPFISYFSSARVRSKWWMALRCPWIFCKPIPMGLRWTTSILTWMLSCIHAATQRTSLLLRVRRRWCWPSSPT